MRAPPRDAAGVSPASPRLRAWTKIVRRRFTMRSRPCGDRQMRRTVSSPARVPSTSGRRPSRGQRHWLRARGHCAHHHMTCTDSPRAGARQQASQLWCIVFRRGLVECVARRARSRNSREAHSAGARKRRLRHGPAPLVQLSSQLLLARHIARCNYFANGTLTLALVGHAASRGSVALAFALCCQSCCWRSRPHTARPGGAIDTSGMYNYAFLVHNIPVGVLGASGYAGRELCALIAGHPALQLVFATANAQRGTTLRVRAASRVHEIPLVAAEDINLSDAALVFSALPHGASADWVARGDLRRVARGSTCPAICARTWGQHPRAAEGVPSHPPYGSDRVVSRTDSRSAVVGHPVCYSTSILCVARAVGESRLIAPGSTVSIAASSRRKRFRCFAQAGIPVCRSHRKFPA